MPLFKFEGRPAGGRRFTWTNIANLVVRGIQIIMACVVIGLYGADLHAARKVAKYVDSKWAYAVVVGSMSAITALVLGVIGIFAQYRTVAILFPWEWILTILWAAVLGIFGSMYFHENPEMDNGVQSMKAAAIIDVINFLLWFITAVIGTAVFFMSPKRSLHTGRATL